MEPVQLVQMRCYKNMESKILSSTLIVGSYLITYHSEAGFITLAEKKIFVGRSNLGKLQLYTLTSDQQIVLTNFSMTLLIRSMRH